MVRSHLAISFLNSKQINERIPKQGRNLQQKFLCEEVHNLKMYYMDIGTFNGHNVRLLETDGFGLCDHRNDLMVLVSEPKDTSLI